MSMHHYGYDGSPYWRTPVKNPNWDDDGNYIGDSTPDSTMDWSVKPVDSAHPLECAGFIAGMIYVFLKFAIPVAFVVWLVILIIGCGPTYHDQSMADIKAMHCPELERLIEEAEKAGIDLTANEKSMKEFCNE